MKAWLGALWQRFNRFTETGLGRDLSIAALVLAAVSVGYQAWRDWPRSKPATLIGAYAEADWRGSYVAVTLHYRLNKVRDDCTYTSDRIIERVDEKGIVRRFVIEGVRGPGAPLGDSGWLDTTFYVPGDLMLPDTEYNLLIRGLYRCPENNFPNDQVKTPFTVPPKPQALAAPQSGQGPSPGTQLPPR